jgi:DNA-binding MarR family transcriptional regulator
MHDAETDAIVAELEKAGLVETFTDDEGKVAYRLTLKGAQLGRSMASAGDEDAGAMLEALLDEGGSSMSTPAPTLPRCHAAGPSGP